MYNKNASQHTILKLIIKLWRIDPLLSGDSVNTSRCYATGD
jgi:hypothetical protein